MNLHDLLRQGGMVIGEQFEGCERCAADVELTVHPEHPNVGMLVVRHDDDCPVLARMNPDGRPPLW